MFNTSSFHVKNSDCLSHLWLKMGNKQKNRINSKFQTKHNFSICKTEPLIYKVKKGKSISFGGFHVWDHKQKMKN